jgi:hypothetical protein
MILPRRAFLDLLEVRGDVRGRGATRRGPRATHKGSPAPPGRRATGLRARQNIPTQLNTPAKKYLLTVLEGPVWR